jgi:hypothetical protein
MNAVAKWKLGLYVLVIFLAGAGSGTLITWQVCQRIAIAPLTPEQIGARLRARFKSRLDLTSDQVQKIDPMIDQAMRQVEVIRRETANRVFANVSHLHEQVVIVLTPEQKAKFDVLEHERHDYLIKKYGPATNAP